MTRSARLLDNGDLALGGMTKEDGQPVIFIAEGHSENIRFNIADRIATGVTATILTEVSNASLTAPSISGGVISTRLTGRRGSGYFDLIATLSDGQVIRQRFITRAQKQAVGGRDYPPA